MKIIISPDSFKGSMTTVEAADQIEAGIRAVFPEARTLKIPMADGGEGTVDTVLSITGGEKVEHDVSDPCGRTRRAGYCWIEKDKTAVIETAAASGLTLVKEDERNPDRLSTFGTGQLIAHALDRGAKKIILGLGGSATVDAGTGCLQALGVTFHDSEGRQLSGCGRALGEIRRIDFSGLEARLAKVEFTVASDVRNPLLGEEGAVRIFGPQKGLSPQQLIEYERNMTQFADTVKASTGRDERWSAGAGAAGGLGFGLLSFVPHLQMVSGFELVAGLSRFKEQLTDADMVITGEGKFDGQSLHGKVPVGISQLAKPFEVPVIVFAGQIEGDLAAARHEGIRMAIPIVDRPMKLEQAMELGQNLLYTSVKRFFETIRFTRDEMNPRITG